MLVKFSKSTIEYKNDVVTLKNGAGFPTPFFNAQN